MEAKVYCLAAGRGYADLIDHDASQNALLMERLGAPLATAGVSIEQQICWICATLHDAWIPLDAPCGLMTGAEKARWLGTFISEKRQLLNQPCEKKTIDRALGMAEERADVFSPDSSVLVHGDAHAFNSLINGVQAGSGFLLGVGGYSFVALCCRVQQSVEAQRSSQGCLAELAPLVVNCTFDVSMSSPGRAGCSSVSAKAYGVSC